MSALIDGEGENAAAQQVRRRGQSFVHRLLQALLIEAGIGAQALWCREIGNQKVDWAIPLRLHDELALEFQRGAEENRQGHGFSEQARDRHRIIVTGKDGVEHRPELHGTAAHIESLDLERNDIVVSGEIEFAEIGGHG